MGGAFAIVRSNRSEPVAAPGSVTTATTVVDRGPPFPTAVRRNRNTPSASVAPAEGVKVAPGAETSTRAPCTGTPCWSTTTTRIGRVEPVSITLKSDRMSARRTTCGSLPPSIVGGSARATEAEMTATKANARTASSTSRAAPFTFPSPNSRSAPFVFRSFGRPGCVLFRGLPERGTGLADLPTDLLEDRLQGGPDLLLVPAWRGDEDDQRARARLEDVDPGLLRREDDVAPRGNPKVPRGGAPPPPGRPGHSRP